MLLNELKIFVSSPIELKEERDVVEKVVAELNRVVARKLGIHMTLLQYEYDAVPGMGLDAQDVINQSIDDDYHIYVGILGTRIGTPTKRAQSGTMEEFQTALARYINNPNAIRIMFYFKEAYTNPFKLDLDQMAQVLDFRNKLSDMSRDRSGLYGSFKDPSEFEGFLRIHLQKQIFDWGTRWGVHDQTLEENKIESVLNEDEDSEYNDDPGLFDLQDIFIDQMELSRTALNNITDAMGTMNNSIGSRTAEITAENAKPRTDLRRVKRMIQLSARDMEAFSKRLDTELPLHEQAFTTSIEAYNRFLDIYITDFEIGVTEQKSLASLRDPLNDLQSVMNTSIVAYQALFPSIAGLPRMTKEFNRAKSRLLTRIRTLVDTFEYENNLVEGLVEVLDRVRDTLPGQTNP